MTRHEGAAGGAHGDDGAEEWLHRLREAFADHDPVPDTLAERVLFAIGLEDIDAEVARLVDDMMQPVGARGEEAARTVTFSSASLTITITITPQEHGHSRIDGWVAPARSLRVEVRRPGGGHRADAPQVQTDTDGRFVLADIPGGIAQLVFHPVGPVGADSDQPPKTVAAPPLEL